MKADNSIISIIIPVLNEEAYVGKLISYIKENSPNKNIKEIIVVDGGSNDNTVGIAENLGATVLHSKKGRARQMNTGARMAHGDILYFLHVDTFPPKQFETNILNAVKNGVEAGCFQMQFDSKSIFLQFFAWFSRINYTLCRGGDQSLFVTKAIFSKTQGFNESYLIYEDNEFIGRLYQNTPFKILPQKVNTSARKYEEKGMVKLQYHFGVLHLKNYLGAGPKQLHEYYKRKIML